MACGCLFGCLIVMMNTLFGLIALIFIAVGSVLHFFAEISTTYFKSFMDSMSSMFDGYNVSIEAMIKGDTSFSILAILKQVALPFIIVGVLLFAICILGCCSVYCSNKTLITVYVTILGLILTAQIITVVVIYVKLSEFRQTTVSGLKKSITNDYEGRHYPPQNETTNLFTSLLDLVQVSAKCCGVDNHTDFANASKWKAKEPAYQVPISCCNFDTINAKSMTPTQRAQCGAANNPQYANINKPCFKLVDDFMESQKNIVIAVVVCILGLQGILVMMAICFCQSIQSKIGPV